MIKAYRSVFGKNHDHPEIVVFATDGFDAAVKSLFKYFEGEVGRGVRFRAGETVQFGWGVLMINELENGDFELLEPDFQSFPIKWVRGLDGTFRYMYLQREVCAQIFVEPSFPSLLQLAVVSPDFFEGEKFSMSRDPGEGSDSGWVIRGAAAVGSDGRYCSLFEVAARNRRIIPFLSLPPGAEVDYSGDSVSVRYGGRAMSSDSNDFLRRVRAGWSAGNDDIIYH